MKVSFKTIEKFMDEICERHGINPDTLEYATDIEKSDEYVVRAYDPENNRSYLVVITKPLSKYIYGLIIRKGENLKYQCHYTMYLIFQQGT